MIRIVPQIVFKGVNAVRTVLQTKTYRHTDEFFRPVCDGNQFKATPFSCGLNRMGCPELTPLSTCESQTTIKSSIVQFKEPKRE
jgi:hypothetical protein